MQTIDVYGDALFGEDWESNVAITATEIQQHLANDAWRTMFNDNETETISYLREAARYLGADALQGGIDAVLALASLPSIDVRQLDWFRDPLPGPATFADFFPEPRDALPVPSTETVIPMTSASASTVSIGPYATSIIEQDGSVSFLVTLDGEATDGFTVDWRTLNGTATGGGPGDPADFVHSSGTLQFADGEEGTSRGISVPINDDTLEEIDETFAVELFNLQPPGSSTSIGNSTSTVTIIDNDPRVSIYDAAPATEANPGDAEPEARFSVTLSKSRPYSISVSWATADGNPGDPPAFQTSDYYANDGQVDFAPGETWRQVSVAIRNDFSFEPTEYFYANLTGASGAIIDDGQGRGTIYDDDIAPTLSVGDVTVNETDGTATLTVTMTGLTSLPVTVDWAAQDLEATHPDDYGAWVYSGTLTFSPGSESSTLSFSIVDDSLMEPNETFLLVLTNASNATIADDTGMCVILANDPKADIDVDSNNDGAIADADDPIETNAPGKIIFWNRDDDNGNTVPDYDDPGPLAAADDDLVPFQLALRQSQLPPATIADLRLTLAVTQVATYVRVWDSATKNNLINLPITWTVAQLPGTLYVEGVATGDATLSLTLYKQSTLQTLDTDSILVTVNFVQLTGHTPETTPFVRQPIPSANEQDPGVYIRRNGDDDNFSNTPDRDDTNVANENDLIYVTIDTAFAAPAGIRFVLERSSADINVWNTSTKATPLLLTQNQTILTLPSVPASMWVEWVTPGIGAAQSTLTLTMQDAVSGNNTFDDRLVFHPFTSVVIVLGGWGQVPTDDPHPDHGIFFVARDLYREGYDVHMYDEDEVTPGPTDMDGDAYAEVLNAVSNRGVTSVAIFGYSYGGGATYHLTDQVNQLRPALTFSIAFTAYVDAVIQDDFGGNPEFRRPLGTSWHLNIYQPNPGPEFGGFAMPEDGPEQNRADEDINTEEDAGFTRGLDHYSIDNDGTVQTHLKSRLRSHVAK
ncbi:MAG: Calx-beta domain-containing protein [Pirellulales bacterium]